MMLSPEEFSSGEGGKVEALAGQLRRIARERGPDGKMPTTREIRDALGVGMATLDNALSELEEQGVIYRKHGVGIFVSPRIHRKTVAVLMDASSFLAPGISPFWGMIWGFLVREAQARAEQEERDEEYVFNLVTVPSAGSDTPLPELLARGVEAGRVHAALGVGLTAEAADWLLRRGVPFVAFAGTSNRRVVLDGRAVVREGVRALADHGCTRIGLWRPVPPYQAVHLEFIVHPEEIGAFGEALTERGLTLQSNLVRQSLHLIPHDGGKTTLTNQEQGFRLAMEVFGPGGEPVRRPDGIVSTDDMMTQGALAAFDRLGVRVGEDVRIATHANRGSHVLFGYEDRLARVEVDPEEIVRAMFAMLDRAFAGEAAGDYEVRLSARRA
jgi:DNA-binding LacI/PurR family transcriptional regulator